ncbi:HAD family acid phosphatase [Bacteriovoracaceae bacterium]|nr:HAD family acid phosphatase [Bacteriovoracaceae bacterium]
MKESKKDNIKDKAIIVDIDGTLADVEHRVHFVQASPKDWKNFNQHIIHDKINPWCLEIIKKFKKDQYKIILLTGRTDDFQKDTEEWLVKFNVPFDLLLMRSESDRREDFEIKKEIYQNNIEPKFDSLFVLEDRLSVVKMWRSLGLTCLQCDWGDF